MAMDQVNALCEQLVKAVTVMMDPSSTQRYRLEALKFCEEFKEKCPVCVPCGLRLAEKTQIAIVRHFGLQILEHVVKFRWNSMSRLEKVYLKNSVMELIENGTLNILEEENHIKDVLSRIVVEMIKREWPQHWPDMLIELDTLSKQGAQANCRVGVAALNTLAGYIDWVSMSHITAENCRLLEVLCLLLNEQELQLGAAECLLIAVSRKGVDSNVETPANFGKYLESFLAFTTHPSQFLRSSTQMTWGALFRHEILSRDPLLLAMIPKYLRASMTNVVKMGFPSKTDSPSCEYSRFDFDSDEDFNAFFNSGIGEGGLCSIFSPSFVHWEAMTFFLESVINQMFRTLDKDEIPVHDGIELLQMVLNLDTKDPLILSCVLTDVSALFPFVTYRPEFLPQVFSKLFSSVTFETVEESKAPRTRAVRNVRRHACSSIIKICRDYPQLVLPNFDMLYNHVKQLLSNELLLTQMEKCALMEALVLISNQFKNYERQKLFLEELMAPVASIWLSEDMHRVLSDVDAFIAYVGADRKSCDPGLEESCGLNRARHRFSSGTRDPGLRSGRSLPSSSLLQTQAGVCHLRLRCRFRPESAVFVFAVARVLLL
ncbi:hypothetical protein QTO34_001484 [Cnephaeus nilssonii]|uniref:Importin N-terminal domain-containing protein n=1 Tax=Cnephaeus nilssonii TaxID=3371016 RepID=A0AA40LNN1_CNENI|nr:hypothetical protein QTO34_001484 [Eptesicus nilssonii]